MCPKWGAKKFEEKKMFHMYKKIDLVHSANNGSNGPARSV